MRRKVTGLVMVLAMAMAFAACGGKDADDVFDRVTPAVSDEKESEDAETSSAEDVDEMKLTAEEIYKLCEDSVVLVDSGVAIGTGFFTEEDVVLTNYHVIEEATELDIKFVDGQRYRVLEVLGYDENIDLALLKVECKRKALMCNTHGITVGEKTYTIGNSLGIEHTFSDGIVTNKDLYENGVNYILTNTAISSGNSGGPLLNEYGEVMGVTTSTFTEGQNLNCVVEISQKADIDVNHPVSVEVFLKVVDIGSMAEEAEKTTSLGRVQGGVYVNEYMGISCALDSNWEFYTAEELQELPQNVEELFAGTEAEDLMSNIQVITDMSAENAEDLTAMNIMYQKMSAQERRVFGSMNNEEFVDGMLAAQKDMLIATYAQAGINVQEMYKKTVNFCGEKRDVIYVASDMNGVPYYAIQVFDYTQGDYAVTMTVSSFVEDKTEELLGLFSKYE